jgi:hypothetical protein
MQQNVINILSDNDKKFDILLVASKNKLQTPIDERKSVKKQIKPDPKEIVPIDNEDAVFMT